MKLGHRLIPTPGASWVSACRALGISREQFARVHGLSTQELFHQLEDGTESAELRACVNRLVAEANKTLASRVHRAA